MNVRKRLSAIRISAELIATKTRQMEELEALKTSIKSSQITGLPRACGEYNNKLDDIIDKIDKLKNEKEQEIERLVELKSSVNYIVQELEESERLLIELRYFECKSWEEIADTMGYCERHVYRIHQSAIENMSVHVM